MTVNQELYSGDTLDVGTNGSDFNGLHIRMTDANTNQDACQNAAVGIAFRAGG